MFALHETTQKRLCRTAFFALCLGPTLACTAWIAYAQRPWRDADEGQRLGAALQARTTLASFETPRPGIERAATLAIADSATGRTLVALDGWESRQRGRVLAISATAATIELENVPAMARKIAGWLADRSADQVEIRIDRLMVKFPAATASAASPDFFLAHLLVRIDADASGARRVTATARPIISGSELPSSGQLRLSVMLGDRENSPAAITMDSTAAPLPAALLSSVLEGAQRLGDRCLFSGEVQLKVAADAVDGVAHGRFEHADLAALLPIGSPHRLTGEATVSLQRLAWRDHRLKEITGLLQSADAQASRSLLAAAIEKEKLLCGQPSVEAATVSIPEGADGSGSLVALDSLNCQFSWDETGLTITGANPSAENGGGGELAVSGGRVILYGPRYNQLSVGRWLRFVDSPAADWLPASRSAVDMAARLPMPQ